MRAIKILRYGQSLKVENFPIPTPKKDQVLIKVKYAPINPSDVYFCKGIYGIRKPLPSPVGFEGVGIIVDCPKKQLINQAVSFLPAEDSEFGSWSEYTVANLSDIIKIPEGMDLRQPACSFINPFTALGFLELTRSQNFKNILFSSSASAVSLISLRLFQHYMTDANIVALRRKGHSLDESITNVKTLEMTEGFEDQIGDLFDGPTVFFDSWAGSQCGKILGRLPNGSKVVSYGSSSLTHIGLINPQDLIFKGKSLEGFWMDTFYKQLSQSQKEEYFQQVISNMNEGQFYYTNIQDILPLSEIKDALEIHRQSMGQGKILLACDL